MIKIPIQPTRSNSVTLVDLVDRILDKGLVINADITVSIAGIELLGIKIRAAIASFETAAKYGLEFPSGTNLKTRSWQQITDASPDHDSLSNPVPYDSSFRASSPEDGMALFSE